MSLRLTRIKEAHNKAAARDATGVSTVRGGRMFCSFAGSQQLVEGAPVSGMPFCGGRAEVHRDTSGSTIAFGAAGSATPEGSESKARGWQRGA